MKKKSKNGKTYKIRILTAVIEVDENGNEEVIPTTLEIPAAADSASSAAKFVQDAIINLVPKSITNEATVDLVKIMQQYQTIQQYQKQHAPKDRDYYWELTKRFDHRHRPENSKVLSKEVEQQGKDLLNCIKEKLL